MARGGEVVVVKAGATIALDTTLYITADCAIVGEGDGRAAPVLRVAKGDLIRSVQGKALRLAGLRLAAGDGVHDNALRAEGGRLEVWDCVMTATNK
eukprot:SAG25_NODE_1124_length_3886_cov_1.713494_2_plen_96_part_00